MKLAVRKKDRQTDRHAVKLTLGTCVQLNVWAFRIVHKKLHKLKNISEKKNLGHKNGQIIGQLLQYYCTCDIVANTKKMAKQCYYHKHSTYQN